MQVCTHFGTKQAMLFLHTPFINFHLSHSKSDNYHLLKAFPQSEVLK